MLNEGLKVMVLGMTGVVAFLLIMVFVTYLSSKIVNLFKGKDVDVVTGGGSKSAHVAAISAAISSYLMINKNK